MYSYYLSRVVKEGLRSIYFYGVIAFGIFQADKYFNNIHDYFNKIVKNNKIEVITIIGSQYIPK